MFFNKFRRIGFGLFLLFYISVHVWDFLTVTLGYAYMNSYGISQMVNTYRSFAISLDLLMKAFMVSTLFPYILLFVSSLGLMFNQRWAIKPSLWGIYTYIAANSLLFPIFILYDYADVAYGADLLQTLWTDAWMYTVVLFLIAVALFFKKKLDVLKKETHR